MTKIDLPRNNALQVFCLIGTSKPGKSNMYHALAANVHQAIMNHACVRMVRQSKHLFLFDAADAAVAHEIGGS